MSYDLWKTRDPNDTGFYDTPEDDGPTELDIAYQRIEALVKALTNLLEFAQTQGDFKNGVTHQGIDEGEVWASGVFDEAHAALHAVVGKVQVP